MNTYWILAHQLAAAANSSEAYKSRLAEAERLFLCVKEIWRTAHSRSLQKTFDNLLARW